MKNVVWDDDSAPIFLIEDDELMILDYPTLYDFEVGDQVQYLLDDRVFVYRVDAVLPECPDDPEDQLNNVTLRRVC